MPKKSDEYEPLEGQDKLDSIVEAQRMYASTIIDFKTLTEADKQRWIEKLCSCLDSEVSELRNETNWKHVSNMGWSTKNKKLNVSRAKKEISDILAFAIEAALVLGMSSDSIYQRYVQTVKDNYVRKARKY